MSRCWERIGGSRSSKATSMDVMLSYRKLCPCSARCMNATWNFLPGHASTEVLYCWPGKPNSRSGFSAPLDSNLKRTFAPGHRQRADPPPLFFMLMWRGESPYERMILLCGLTVFRQVVKRIRPGVETSHPKVLGFLLGNIVPLCFLLPGIFPTRFRILPSRQSYSLVWRIESRGLVRGT